MIAFKLGGEVVGPDHWAPPKSGAHHRTESAIMRQTASSVNEATLRTFGARVGTL